MVAGRYYRGWYVWYDDFMGAWFAEKGGEKIGPLTYSEILAQIQRG